MSKVRPCCRRGATTVEAAFIISLIFLFLFGILEYCRYAMVLQVYNGAAREGARYAAIHTYDKVTADVQNQVDHYLAGQGRQLLNYDKTVNIQVYKADPATGSPLDANNAVVTNWTSAPFTNAGFGKCVAVKITGQYQPILPGLLHFAGPRTVTAQCIMQSEAN